TPFLLPDCWRPTPAQVGQGRSRPHPIHRFGRVVWLEKTQRNPFANLITVGRAPNNDIRYPLESLSKLHATFCRSGSKSVAGSAARPRWLVQDHSSKNGTFVNDEPLPPGKVQELKDGDQVRFCRELKARFFTAPALYDFVNLVAKLAPREDAAP
ncbi:MAG: FHA domain-containing protein, partial [Planctomycetota bacterium]